MPIPLVQNLKATEQNRVNSDLLFIQNFHKFSKSQQFRTVLSGGYALDSCLHTISRPHNDIDLIVYSDQPRHTSEQLIKVFVFNNYKDAVITSHAGPFNTSLSINYPLLGVDIYIVETVNHPQRDIHTVRKLDGEVVVNSVTDFPLPIITHLKGIKLESQNPTLQLSQILQKRKTDQALAKHDQDITNLNLLINNQ